MSSSIIDYLDEYGRIPFSERELCDADCVVLSQLCYLKFDGLITDDSPVLLRSLNSPQKRERMLDDPKYAKENGELYKRLISSKRFRELTVSHYESIIDKEVETQFCAMIFSIPDEFSFVAFRGTDETMVGWKEDFNLTYMDQVPAQKMALDYLKEAAGIITGDFYVGGHSKGGHLSIYSSMHAPKKIRKRLIRIYCLDGPGFMKGMVELDGYMEIRDRIVKLLPQSSLVGMLQERDTVYTVIKSTGAGLLQHNLYNWVIENGELVPEEEIKGRARVVDTALNDWIESLDSSARQQFVDSLYSILTSCDADNRVDFMADFYKNTTQLIRNLRGIDPETKQMLKSMLIRIFDDAAEHYRNELGINDAAQIEAWIRKHRPRWRTGKNSKG